MTPRWCGEPVASQRNEGSVLILRAWVEPDSPGEVRARLISNTGGEEVTVGTATGVDDVCELVRGWLRGLEGPAAGEVRDR